MNPRSIITTVLLAFVAVSVGYLVVTEMRGADDAAPVVTAAAAPSSDAAAGRPATHKVVAYYFHNTQRCSTCLEIERRSEAALKAEFADALERGTLEWRVLNMEEPPNAHFVTDYALVTSSLVIVDVHDGRQRAWASMDRVWELVHDDETAFTDYVAKQVRAYLES